MIRFYFVIIIINIFKLSAGTKLQLSHYTNWTATSNTYNIGLIRNKIYCSSFTQLFNNCGEDIYVKEDDIKSVCCGIWEAFDCVEKKAKGCDNEQQILRDLKSYQSSIERGGCSEYKRDETVCGLAWWAIAIIAIGSIVVVGGCSFLVYRKCKNKH